MADIDINDLTQARFMGLMCPASSPQSKLLVNDLVDILIKTEQRQRARKADDMAAFRNGVSLITGDLLIAMEVKEAGWSSWGAFVRWPAIRVWLTLPDVKH